MKYEIGDRVMFRDKRKSEVKEEIGIIVGVDRCEHRRSYRPVGTVYYIRPERNDLWEERYAEEIRPLTY